MVTRESSVLFPARGAALMGLRRSSSPAPVYARARGAARPPDVLPPPTALHPRARGRLAVKLLAGPASRVHPRGRGALAGFISRTMWLTGSSP